MFYKYRYIFTCISYLYQQQGVRMRMVAQTDLDLHSYELMMRRGLRIETDIVGDGSDNVYLYY